MPVRKFRRIEDMKRPLSRDPGDPHAGAGDGAALGLRRADGPAQVSTRRLPLFVDRRAGAGAGGMAAARRFEGRLTSPLPFPLAFSLVPCPLSLVPYFFGHTTP